MPRSSKQAAELAPQDAEEAAVATGEHLDRVIDEGLFAMHFQPIVDLRTQSIFAHEALCRPQGDYFKSPVDLISAAVDADRIGELGRLQRTRATEGCAESAIFLNLEPHEFDAPFLVRPDDPIFKHRQPVYLEITENVPLKYFAQCHSVLGELRKKGILLVIDDFGAGFSNLKYIADLAPDIVKLDRELVQGCTIATSEFTLLKSITALCHHMQARVVAEGIETAEELEAVIAAGVDFGQGYLLAKPAPEPPEIKWPAELATGGGESAAAESARLDPENTAFGEALDELGSGADRELQAEVNKLNELLIESELARLALVKRLREQPASTLSGDHAKQETVPGAGAAVNAQPEPPLQQSRPVEPSPPRKLLEHAESPQPTAFISREEPGPPLWRRALLIALPIAVIGLLWTLWSLVNGEPAAETIGGLASQTAGMTSPAVETQPAVKVARPIAVPAERSRPSAAEPEPASQLAIEINEASPPMESEPEPASATSDPVSNSTSAASEIARRVDDWAQAWSEQRVEDYLASYSVDFRPDTGGSFREWARLRRERLERPAWINVEVSQLEITFPGTDLAWVSFHQAYSSPGYSDEVVKILELTLEGDQWRILSERAEDSAG